MNKPVRLYLDTEFTEFEHPKLLSLGIVSETDNEFYAEVTDGWTEDDCPDFVIDEVLPARTEDPNVQVTTKELKARLVTWLESLGPAPVTVKIVFDSQIDWTLIRELCGNLNTPNLDVQTEWLSWPGSAMARRCEELLEEYFVSHGPRHNALVDARALRDAVVQTEAEFRAA